MSTVRYALTAPFLLLILASPAWAQKKLPKPKKDDTVGIACSPESSPKPGTNALAAFQRAKSIMSSEPMTLALQPSLARQAVILFCESGRAGNPVAAFNAADLIEQGHFASRGEKGGYPLYMPDPWLATFWYQIAAEGGYGPAMTRMANRYRSGVIVDKKQVMAPDPAKADYWSKKAGGTEDTRRLALEYQDAMQAKPPNRARAEEVEKNIKAILNNNQMVCEKGIDSVRNQLPVTLRSRRVEKTAALRVAGSVPSRQIVCQINLAEPAPKPDLKASTKDDERGKELAESLKRIDDAQGGDILIWHFTITESDNNVNANLESVTSARIGLRERQDFEKSGLLHLIQIIQP